MRSQMRWLVYRIRTRRPTQEVFDLLWQPLLAKGSRRLSVRRGTERDALYALIHKADQAKLAPAALPEEIRHLGGYNSDNLFYQWCEKQPHTHLYPLTGDVVVFFSHIPHQGAKLRQENDGDPLRCNVVLHYQQTPMFPGIPFVSSPLPAIAALGYNGTFPFIDH